jgi:hexulose-6-phosphate isomerase
MYNRRDFLGLSAMSLLSAGSISAGGAEAATAESRWRKAFMLGQTEGDIRPAFDRLKQAGFEGVEMISPNSMPLEEVLKARDATGLVIHGVSGGRHWKLPLSHPDPDVVSMGKAAIRQEIVDCKAYGGTTVLVVPAVVTPQVSYQDAWTRSQAAIRELIPEAEKHGIVLAIEEVWNKFLLSPLEFARYIDEFQSPWVKAYFDVGNVVEFGYPQEWIRELGPRIVKIHIKEYAKPKRFDYKLGEGEVDWKDVRQALIDIGYEGWVTAEVPGKDLETLQDVVRRMDMLLA